MWEKENQQYRKQYKMKKFSSAFFSVLCSARKYSQQWKKKSVFESVSIHRELETWIHSFKNKKEKALQGTKLSLYGYSVLYNGLMVMALDIETSLQVTYLNYSWELLFWMYTPAQPEKHIGQNDR